jgi:uncharacterized protein (DUF4415 family)
VDIEFDPAKDAVNIRKHGLPLADAHRFELGDAVVEIDNRADYGEVRYRAFGRIDGIRHCLVFTFREDAVRIISFRARVKRRCAAMADRVPPVVFDDDNPEWTEEDFARARPAAEVLPAEVIAAFAKAKTGRPRGSNKEQVALRIDKDVLAKFRATGPGWQTRINEALRRAEV